MDLDTAQLSITARGGRGAGARPLPPMSLSSSECRLSVRSHVRRPAALHLHLATGRGAGKGSKALHGPCYAWHPLAWPSGPGPVLLRSTCARWTVRDCSEPSSVRSGGDNGGSGSGRCRGVFHLGLILVGRELWHPSGLPAVNACLVLSPFICHLSDVTGFIWIADFKGAFQIFLIFLFQG